MARNGKYPTCGGSARTRRPSQPLRRADGSCPHRIRTDRGGTHTSWKARQRTPSSSVMVMARRVTVLHIKAVLWLDSSVWRHFGKYLANSPCKCDCDRLSTREVRRIPVHLSECQHLLQDNV